MKLKFIHINIEKPVPILLPKLTNSIIPSDTLTGALLWNASFINKNLGDELASFIKNKKFAVSSLYPAGYVPFPSLPLKVARDFLDEFLKDYRKKLKGIVFISTEILQKILHRDENYFSVEEIKVEKDLVLEMTPSNSQNPDPENSDTGNPEAHDLPVATHGAFMKRALIPSVARGNFELAQVTEIPGPYWRDVYFINKGNYYFLVATDENILSDQELRDLVHTTLLNGVGADRSSGFGKFENVEIRVVSKDFPSNEPHNESRDFGISFSLFSSEKEINLPSFYQPEFRAGGYVFSTTIQRPKVLVALEGAVFKNSGIHGETIDLRIENTGNIDHEVFYPGTAIVLPFKQLKNLIPDQPV